MYASRRLRYAYTLYRYLNRFMEDQFVIWSPEDYPVPQAGGSGGMGLVGMKVNLRTPVPMVM